MEKDVLEGKKIILGITGSIAAYKAATLVSMLIKRKANVHVIMTQNATKFISPLTFETLSGNKVHTDTFDLSPDHKVHHITLVKDCDIFLIAQATANIIAKIVHGISDDMLTSTFIACHSLRMISPAMNTFMYENPINQDNISLCNKYGIKVIEPASGRLACGDSGKGKMPEPEFILEEIIHEIGYKKDLKGKKILITAGPTQESLDPVRYITNHSTGKMGYAIAKVAANRGANVILVSGPVNIPPPHHVTLINIITAKDMFEVIKKEANNCDIIIKAAAVADFRPKNYSENKIKKKEEQTTIELEKTDDILKYLGENKKEGQILNHFSSNYDTSLQQNTETDFTNFFNNKKNEVQKYLTKKVINDLYDNELNKYKNN